MYGAEYVIEHVTYEYNRKCELEVYRSYTADMLLGLNRQLGSDFSIRYSDVIKREPQEDDDQTGDEIVLAVMKKAGLKGKTNGLNDAGSEAIA